MDEKIENSSKAKKVGGIHTNTKIKKGKMTKILSKLHRIFTDRRTIDLLIVIEILLIGFIVFVKLFRPGLVAFVDNPPHFIEAWSLVNYIIPNKLGFYASIPSPLTSTNQH